MAAAPDAVMLRQSMKTPPLFEIPSSRTSYIFEAPTRQSIIFTQPVIDPDYRNSTINFEPKPRRPRSDANRNSALLSNDTTARPHSVFLEQPTRQAATGARIDPATRHSAIVGVGDRPARKPVRRNPRQRHTIVDPPSISITKEPLLEEPLPEEPLPSAANVPARPPLKSEISDLYGLNSSEILPQHRPSVAARSESTLVNQPLVKKTQLRPNADQIRKRRQSRASKAASTPLSSSFGVGISSMTHGGNNVGLKDMNYGNFGMNQNFNLVNNRTTQYMATQEEESDDTAVEEVDKFQRQRKAKKTKKWFEVLFSWAKLVRHSKYNEEKRQIRKERVDATPI